MGGLVDFLHKAGSSHQGVLPPIHPGCAGMVRMAPDGYPMAVDTDNVRNDGTGFTCQIEFIALLHMEFQESMYLLLVYPPARQGGCIHIIISKVVGQRPSLFVAQGSQFVHCHLAGHEPAPQTTDTEDTAFLFDESNHFYRALRPVANSMPTVYAGDGGYHAEGSVEAAPVRNRIEVGTGHNVWQFGLGARIGADQIADGIAFHRHTRRRHQCSDIVPALSPGFGIGWAGGAAAGSFAETVELCDLFADSCYVNTHHFTHYISYLCRVQLPVSSHELRR